MSDYTNIAYYRIFSIEEIDFNGLFDNSYQKMCEGTYPWHEDIDTFEQRKEFIRKFIEGIFRSKDAFGFVAREAGTHDLCAIIGMLYGDKFDGLLSLAQPDLAYNNRSYVYDAFVIQSMYDFCKSYGIKEFWGYLPKNSPLRNTIPPRINFDQSTFTKTNTIPGMDEIDRFKLLDIL